MSTTQCMYSIIAALVKAEEMPGMGPNRVWIPSEIMQDVFLRVFFQDGRREIGNIPQIESLASWNVDEINRFLTKRGFSIQLDPLDDKTFGVASVLDLLVEWFTAGERTTVTIEDQTYPGVRISNDGVLFYSVEDHPNPVVALKTKSGDNVFMTMLEEAPDDPFSLVVTAQLFVGWLKLVHDYDGLVFPMVQLNQEVDLGWLIGLNTFGLDGQPAVITQALQQNKLRMNEFGARAQSAVALAVKRGFSMPKPDHVINRPFLVWFSRPGLSHPLFAAHVTPEDWKDPGDISQI